MKKELKKKKNYLDLSLCFVFLVYIYLIRPLTLNIYNLDIKRCNIFIGINDFNRLFQY